MQMTAFWLDPGLTSPVLVHPFHFRYCLLVSPIDSVEWRRGGRFRIASGKSVAER